MASLSTTTLGAAVTAGATLWPLASVSGVTVGSVLFTNGEAALVTGQPLGLSVPVQRGMLGSTVQAHGSGLTVYLGATSQFYQQNPSGTPPTTLDTDPWINTVNGTIWTSSGGQWVQVSTSGSSVLPSPSITGTVSGSATYSTPTVADPVVTLSAGTGSFGDRVVDTEAFAITGAALHAGVLTAVTFPAAAVITRAWLNITTASTGASTVDVGYTAVTATTASDTLLDGVSGTPAAIFDSMDALLDSGANAHAQVAASAKWVTVAEASGDATGMVATLYVQYVRT